MNQYATTPRQVSGGHLIFQNLEQQLLNRSNMFILVFVEVKQCSIHDWLLFSCEQQWRKSRGCGGIYYPLPPIIWCHPHQSLAHLIPHPQFFLRGSKTELCLEVESNFPHTASYVYITNGVIMVSTTFESSKINTLIESNSQLNEIRPIPAVNELLLLTA